MSEDHKRKIGLANKGKVRTKEAKEKNRQWHLGKPVWNKGLKGMQKKSPRAYKFPKGKLHPSWKGGITILTTLIRTSEKYKLWRSKVYQRDKWICQTCKKLGQGDLEAHHIKSFSKILEEYNIKSLEDAFKCKELWAVSNGITLCEECHYQTFKNRK